MYESNEIDVSVVPLEQMDRVMAADSEFAEEYKNTPRNCTYYYGFVTKREAVSDVSVRRALSMAVDRKTLVENILKGGQIPGKYLYQPAQLRFTAGDTDVAPWALTEEQGGLGYAAAVEWPKD